LKGEELKNFRKGVNDITVFSGGTGPILNLWTDRGAARHAKMLGTDEAWEVWKMLAKVGADRVFADLFGADVG
jgi:hypothetical protein